MKSQKAPASVHARRNGACKQSSKSTNAEPLNFVCCGDFAVLFILLILALFSATAVVLQQAFQHYSSVIHIPEECENGTGKPAPLALVKYRT